ncbi:MAG: hypothetical protein ACAH27_05540 [Xanthobacteraceae bacterium]
MTVEHPLLKARGARWYVTRDHGGGLNLSKAALGEFVHEVLRRGGQIGEFFAMNPQWPRSFVQASVLLPPDVKEAMERETRFRFSDPPKVNLA